MNIPSTLTAGDTFAWTDTLADYLAPTWTLKYSLWRVGKAVIFIVGTASGTNHAIAISAATSLGYTPGEWQWTAYAEKGAGASLERKSVASGTVTVKPALHAASGASDFRSHAEKVLDAVQAVIEGRADKSQASITINGKAIAYMKHDELLKLRTIYQREVAKQKGQNTLTRIQFGSA